MKLLKLLKKRISTEDFSPDKYLTKIVKFMNLAFLSLIIFVGLITFVIINNTFAQEGTMKKAAGIIELSKPVLKGSVSIEEAMHKRRSIRSYSDKPVSMEQISQLLWATQGITNKRGFRTAPSAGALYPLEIYLMTQNGLYHYIPQGHKLEIKSAADLRERLCRACWGQAFVAQAPVNIIICAVYERITSRYGQRGARYVDIEVGHAAENLHLQAVALGLGSVPVGAFDDNAVRGVMSLPDEENPVYIIPVGYAK